MLCFIMQCVSEFVFFWTQYMFAFVIIVKKVWMCVSLDLLAMYCMYSQARQLVVVFRVYLKMTNTNFIECRLLMLLIRFLFIFINLIVVLFSRISYITFMLYTNDTILNAYFCHPIFGLISCAEFMFTWEKLSICCSFCYCYV